MAEIDVLPAEGYAVLGSEIHRRYGEDHPTHLQRVNAQILAASLRGEEVRLRTVDLAEVLADLLAAQEVAGTPGGEQTRDTLAAAVLALELSQSRARRWSGSAEGFLEAYSREHEQLQRQLEIDEVLGLVFEEIGPQPLGELTIAAAEVVSDLLDLLDDQVWARVSAVSRWRGDRYTGDAVVESGEVTGLALVRGLIILALHGGGMVQIHHPLTVGDELVVVSAGWVLADGRAVALSASELSETYEEHDGAAEMVFADAPAIGLAKRER